MDGLPDKTTVTVALPSETVEALDRIAAALGEDRGDLIRRALGQYMAAEGADLLAEIEGLEQAERGETVDFDEVMEEAKAIIAEAEARNGARKTGT
ncbi:MAG TPA: ribbon-helix-helix protein, CopG family [Azospirillaceae bacterium]|nr:ribbon-helix-helix protein, CopG family [Azospirillaceae bacterium]